MGDDIGLIISEGTHRESRRLGDRGGILQRGVIVICSMCSVPSLTQYVRY